MIVKDSLQGMAEQVFGLYRPPCHGQVQKKSAYDSAYWITAQKCRSAYEGVYKPIPKCLRQCLHYYIVTIGITVVGTLNKLYILLKRLCRTLRIFILILFIGRK